MAKRILQIFLVLLFIVLVVCGIIIGSYVFSSPNTELGSESRLLITGAWEDPDSDTKLEFDENGKFKVSILSSDTVEAEGFYRINEDRDLIKLFMFPGQHEESFNDYVRLFCFAQITYSNLKDNNIDYKKKYELKDAPVCTFLIKKAGSNTEGKIVNAKMPEKTLDLYSKGKKFEAKNK
ncbi:MAG: hypothetical protein IKP47_11770 [Ruminococcus sp.]|nr:hypothetical protein [Ruminococcus sp.]